MLNILVIDDERPILDLIRLALTSAGFEVEIASDGQEGIQKFEDGQFDLVITDMQMPGIDGRGVVKHIRNSAKPDTPTIGWSGTPWLFENSELDSVLKKPFSLKDLFSSIQDLSPKAVAN